MEIKKLIEVALPLEKINAESAREKSIHYGHPASLHLWWARRPLATTRAIIWASLVDDPSSHPDKFPSEEEQNLERKRLFKILEDLVVWENSTNQDVLNAAKKEIMQSTDNSPPELLDPFSGGGAIPIEAQRLGLVAHAHDLNPVSIIINKAMIEIPPRFESWPPVNPGAISILGENQHYSGSYGLAEDVMYYGKMLQDELFNRVGEFYPKIKTPQSIGGVEIPVIAWLWARTVKCPNPACGCEMPLVKSRVIAKDKAYIDFKPDMDKGKVYFEVKSGKTKNTEGTVSRKGATCICCGNPVNFGYIREEGKKGNLSSQLIAIVGKNRTGKVYLSPTIEHQAVAESCFPEEENLGNIAIYPGYLNPPAYGLETFESLFTKRQLRFLQSLTDSITTIEKIVVRDAVKKGIKNDQLPLSECGKGAFAYGEAIRVYLSFLADKMVDYHSSVSSWNAAAQTMRNTFGLTGMSMSWDYAEANPFSGATGSFNMLDNIVKAIRWLPATGYAEVKQHNAQEDSCLRNVMVSTDPPYYSNVPYANFADYFYVWMRRNLRDVYPKIFSTMQTPKAEELVADPYRAGSKEKAASNFESGMLDACKQIYLCARDDVPVTIYYAYKQQETDENDNISSDGWETMLTAIIKAGFTINGTWPVRTEKPGRVRENGANALASSIVLVCRKRVAEATICTRRNFFNELKRELKPALIKLQSSNIAPVDISQSAIGPGMGVYSKFSQVLEADGTPMTVRSALHIINQELDLYFNEQDDELDSESRFCVDLYSQVAFNDIKFGVADTLARAKNTSVAVLVSRGTLFAQRGVVHLKERTELPTNINSNESNIWLICQQLSHLMETGGVESCAKVIVDMFGSNAERAKNLAYRLYTIAERKNWAQEAYAYNALVVAWPEIQSRAAELKAIVPEQISLLDMLN